MISDLAQGSCCCTCAAPPEGLLCKRAMQTYSFPAPCCDFTSLVALSTHTIKLPVTLGSRVPLWPVFVTLRMRRIQATTSCEEGFEGLSRLMTPYLLHKGGASEQMMPACVVNCRGDAGCLVERLKAVLAVQQAHRRADMGADRKSHT